MTKCRIIASGNTINVPQERIVFDGEFTDTIRECFKAHRLHLGVSLQQLGRFLQINWSTIRKWESGRSRRCHAKHISRVNNFLNHIYDARLTLIGKSDDSLQDIMERVPVELQKCLEKAWTVFGVCCCYVGEEEFFLKALGETLDSTSKSLLENCFFGGKSEEDSVKYVAEEKWEYASANAGKSK